MTLTFDLWSWTFAVNRLWRDETRYQIWTQSSYPRRSYCDFNIWPNDLEHCVTCWARLWDNFHQVWPSTTYPCLNYSVFMLVRCHAVTLTFDLLTLNFYNSSGIMRANFFLQNFERNRIIRGRVNWRFSTLSCLILWSGALLTNSYQGCVDPTQLRQTWRGHRAIIAALQFCFRVRMPSCIFKRGCLKFEWCWKRRQIPHFLTVCEN